jgi:ERO1-like protein beta
VLAGYGAALKVLFEFDNNAADVPQLKRTELVALFNTLGRISDSLTAIHHFRTMVEAEETEEESEGHYHVVSNRAKKPHHVIPGKPYLNPVDADLEEFEYFEEEFKRRNQEHPQPVSEAFWSELDLFWKVTKYVVKGWITFPKVM